jgi:hypothetical protein
MASTIHYKLSFHLLSSIHDVLETIRVRCVLDEYLQPTASSVYTGVKDVLKVEISSLNAAAQEALYRGESVTPIRLFLEGSTAFAHHFTDVDFRSDAGDLLKRKSWKRLCEFLSRLHLS